MDQLLSQLVLGIVSGALLVLLALGLNLIFGLLEFINFSHGALYMVGAYLTSYLAVATGTIWLALLVVPIAMALIGAVLERTVIRPMYGRDQVDALLLTFGLTYILIEGVRYLAGSGGRRVPAPEILAFQVNLGLGRPVPAYLLFVVVAVALVVGGSVALPAEDQRRADRAGRHPRPRDDPGTGRAVRPLPHPGVRDRHRGRRLRRRPDRARSPASTRRWAPTS